VSHWSLRFADIDAAELDLDRRLVNDKLTGYRVWRGEVVVQGQQSAAEGQRRQSGRIC